MSASNWINDNRDMSPDRNNQYGLDYVGLQVRLGLPLPILGVSLAGDRHRLNGHQWPGSERVTQWTGSDRVITGTKNKPKFGDIQQTVDGIPIRKVYISNLGIEVNRPEIYDIFKPYGVITHVYLGVSKNDSSKQFAFITYKDPKDAARVLTKRKFQDCRHRNIYVSAADSWHQPQEGPNGNLFWKDDRRAQTKEGEESEDDEVLAVGVEGSQIQTVEITEEGLNRLNDDCLLHIFSFLSCKEVARIETVCKRWQSLSFRMWRCIHELSFMEPPFNTIKTTTPTLEQCLKRCGESLTVLDLAVVKHEFNNSTLAIIAKYCHHLEVLRLANLFVGNRSLAHLGRCCPMLKHLVMDGCIQFSDNDLMSLLPKCRDLSHLSLSHSNVITGKCLANIPGPITELKLCYCSAIEANHLIDGLQRMSSTLKILTLRACNNLRSSEVDRIVSAVPNLTSLSLCHCFPQFDNKSLAPIGQLSKLTSLNLKLNSAVNDRMLAAIVEGCDNLTYLNLSGCGGGCPGILSDRGLSMLARLRKLTDLNISYLDATNAATLKSLAQRSTRLRKLTCRGCPSLNDEGCIQVVTMCNELELFDLSGCNNVSENTISAALTSVKIRTNNVPLKLIMGGTEVDVFEVDKDVPQVTVDLSDLSEEHLRPDFIDDIFFPLSDSEDEEDLDHLCERIGCDCDFDFDDLYDPTLFPSDFDDDTPKFGAFDDTPDFVYCTDNDAGDGDQDDFESWD